MGNKDHDASDSDDSDEDFVVGSEEDLSEESGNSDCEGDDLNEIEKDDSPEPEKTDNEIKLSAEEEKERADLLWKSFLSDTGTPSKSSTSPTKSVTASASNSTCKSVEEKESPISKLPAASSSGDSKEEIHNSEQPKDPAPPDEDKKIEKKVVHPLPQPNIPKRTGLSSFISSIGKKSKVTVLEKSKLDWNQYKQDNNLSEEINTFNRGKSGFLERQDFLQRADSRQFEIEKELRNAGKRSLR
ncbi:hypothetical protein QAD02_015760 [Eretmocerus hayati]|uniref:Uncharacterized protein n=1 Tax=Eretmocerus hayati TaxID=131215 RepID=A0ACC2P985_9HYME|nr:hypothetical protein QAD02_015760 [Eretmocerus hayati]